MGKKVSFFGLWGLHNREEIQIKRLGMIEDQLKTLYGVANNLRDENTTLKYQKDNLETMFLDLKKEI